MPELPEVETTVIGLRKKVIGRTIESVWTDWEKIIKKPGSFKHFSAGLKGKEIKNVWRRAKNVISELSGGYSLLVHQKMTGHLLYGKWKKRGAIWLPSEDGPLNDPYNRFLHLILFLDNGDMIALSDARKFAKAELWKTGDLLNSEEFKRIGPEPLAVDFTFEKFKGALRGRKGKIKTVIMNPEIIAGVGNIYSSEALWQAKIHPLKNVAELSESELKNFYSALQKVLKLGVNLGGESFSDYRKPDGSKGDFDSERKAYKRENEPCSRCGTKIKRIKIGQRSAFFCPFCQKQ